MFYRVFRGQRCSSRSNPSHFLLISWFSDPERKQLSSSAAAPSTSSLGPPRSETRFKDRDRSAQIPPSPGSEAPPAEGGRLLERNRQEGLDRLSVVLALPLPRRHRLSQERPSSPPHKKRARPESGNSDAAQSVPGIEFEGFGTFSGGMIEIECWGGEGDLSVEDEEVHI